MRFRVQQRVRAPQAIVESVRLSEEHRGAHEGNREQLTRRKQAELDSAPLHIEAAKGTQRSLARVEGSSDLREP